MTELILPAIGAVGFVAGWIRYMPRLKRYARKNIRTQIAIKVTVHSADGTEILRLSLGRSDFRILHESDTDDPTA
ncbi:hypothetical protein ACFYT3_05360 [Nocardia amikacinitolerans]|uniref:hypothetical protein n=1 Tax=Nocardia amikacinitolerans TaxID=756689 RepID=UPI0036C3536F